jgi:hypothetical protein
MDINENIKQMFHDDCGYTVGTVYKIAPKVMLSPLIQSLDYHHFTVSEGGQSGHFNILDSYLYIFNTKIAFLCVGISFEEMSVLERICNPGYAINPAVFSVCCKDGSAYDFSIDEWLLNICKPWKLERFYNNHSSMLLESYTYILGLSDTFFPSLESLRISFLVRPNSRKGERTCNSVSACIPGRSAGSSEAFVPSMMTEKPSTSACLQMAENSFFLQ